MFLRRFENFGSELLVIKIFKYFFLIVGVFGLILLAMNFVDWRVGTFDFKFLEMDKVKSGNSEAFYLITFGFNSYSFFNYLNSVVLSRNRYRTYNENTRRDLASMRNDFNSLIHTNNIYTRALQNVETMTFNDIITYVPRDRILLCYNKLRWMNQMELENNGVYMDRFKEKYLLQIRLDENLIGYDKILKDPITCDMDAITEENMELNKFYQTFFVLNNPKTEKTFREKRSRYVQYN